MDKSQPDYLGVLIPVMWSLGPRKSTDKLPTSQELFREGRNLIKFTMYKEYTINPGLLNTSRGRGGGKM